MTKEISKAPDQSILDALKSGSGEAENANIYNFIPYITIDNGKVEVELKGGKKAWVLCDPQFNITNKEDKEYTTTLFAPEFNATILIFKHRIQRKFLYDNATKKSINKHEFFRSLEFSSFKSDIYVRQSESFLPAMKYQDAKSKFGEELELWSVAYILIEGEDTVRKAEFKGASRGVLFDFMTSKKEYTTSAYTVKFTGEVVESANPYNKLKIETIGLAPNLEEILAKQTELNKMLDAQSSPNEVTNTKPLQLDVQVSESDEDISIDTPVDKLFN